VPAVGPVICKIPVVAFARIFRTVKSFVATLTVALDCTIGKTSVPASGVVAEVSADILLLLTNT
jgi:hypothetical protein